SRNSLPASDCCTSTTGIKQQGGLDLYYLASSALAKVTSSACWRSKALCTLHSGLWSSWHSSERG
ncbi:hypothetical protein CTA1_12916, partial [Colletotrichum tanaceti]